MSHRNQRIGMTALAKDATSASRLAQRAENQLQNQKTSQGLEYTDLAAVWERAARLPPRTIWPCRGYPSTPGPAGSLTSILLHAGQYLRGTFSMPLMQNTPRRRAQH